MEIHYTQRGDYYLPDLTLSPDEEPRYGKYGMLRKTFLIEHRRGTYSTLLMSAKLTRHLNEIDAVVREQVQQTMAAMARQTCEPGKASDFMGWVQWQNSLKAQAEEIALADFIYQ